MEETMTEDEAESIVMAAEVGANYPEELLPMAILLLAKREL